MARTAAAPATLPLQSWLSLATELRSIEEQLERLADSHDAAPGRIANRSLRVHVRTERRTAELLAHPEEIPEPLRRLA